MADKAQFALLESLEPRKMLSNTPIDWRIEGTPNDDQIVIRASADHPGRIEAVVNGVMVGSRAVKNLHKVLIKAGRGNDRVRVQAPVEDHPLLFRLYGGRGDDNLIGGPGRDILIGGSGTDRLDGGKDNLRDVFYRDALDTLIRSRHDVIRARPTRTRPLQIITPDPPLQITPDPTPASSLEEGINRFAFDLYSVLAQKSADKNLFFSPYSIATALGMLAAKGPQEAANVSALLHRPDADLLSSFGQFLHRWQADPDAALPYDLNMVNAAWFSKALPYPQQFADLLQADFNAKIDLLNFAQNQAASDIINGWVSEQTHGRIPSLIDPSTLDGDTSFVLTNAVYFKGEWEHGFDPQFTLSSRFWLTNGKTENVAMMYQSESFNYFANDQLQLLELPYKGDDLSMVVLLPAEHNGLQELRASLSADNLKLWLDQARRQEVLVYLPRFGMDNRMSLLEPLNAMGMNTASIGEIVHQANIDVNEEGTIAAAATGIVGATDMCVCPPVIPPTFEVDHPFIYAIRDRKTGGLVFIGQETKPPEAPANMPTGLTLLPNTFSVE